MYLCTNRHKTHTHDTAEKSLTNMKRKKTRKVARVLTTVKKERKYTLPSEGNNKIMIIIIVTCSIVHCYNLHYNEHTMLFSFNLTSVMTLKNEQHAYMMSTWRLLILYYQNSDVEVSENIELLTVLTVEVLKTN
uniref:Uncharacterized protein n=1 Tax=Cacopsylla melanoneura TaxID=428564 RepID=A0A8D8REE5_9HEMI